MAKQTNVSDVRKQLRDKIFTSDRAKPKSETLEFFGADVELRQPTIGRILDLRDAAKEDSKFAAMQMIIEYTYVPGTNERVFDEADLDALLGMPFGEDMTRMHQAIAKLTNINVEGLAKNSEETPAD